MKQPTKNHVAYLRENYTMSDKELEDKKTLLSEYAKNMAIDDLMFYVDNGLSGINQERPSYAELKKDIADKKVANIFVYGIGRISRSYLEANVFFSLCLRNHVSIFSVCEPNFFDSGNILYHSIFRGDTV